MGDRQGRILPDTCIITSRAISIPNEYQEGWE